MLRIKFVIATIFLVMLVTGTRGSDNDFIFERQPFSDSATSVVLHGNLKGADVPFKNNSYLVWCLKDQGNCLVASVQQIDERLVGGIDAYYLPVTEWGLESIVAADAGLGCWKTTITISRKTKKALWIEEPVNRSKDFCKEGKENSVKKWTID
jgi:hypothetical protein